jgi:soluble lytic murein transglycosylase-like protein
MQSRPSKQLLGDHFVTQLSPKRSSFNQCATGRVFAGWHLVLLTFLLVALSADEVSAAPLYKHVSNRGVVTFTSTRPKGASNYSEVRPPAPRYSTMMRNTGHRGAGRKWRMTPRPSEYDELILSQAKQYRLEPALVKAIVHAESSFNPLARSHKGAKGLMQLMPATARRFGVYDSYSPDENVGGGVKYLRWLFERFSGNIVHVIAGYNAGEGAVDRYGGIPPYSETQTYVRRVLRLRDIYRCDYTGRKSC